MLIEGPLPPGTPLVPMYTIYPPEVWSTQRDEGPGTLQRATWYGRWVLVSADGRLERLLSTYPPDFLDPRFAPGARLPGAEATTSTSPTSTRDGG